MCAALAQSFLHRITSHTLRKCINVHAVCRMIPRPVEAKHLLFILKRDEEILEAERKCIFLRFSFGGVSLITGWRWYISVAHRKRIIFQWKPKPYCWECTIWISKGFAPTSIFSGITQESARGGKTDWWWIMYTFSKLWCLATWCCVRRTQIISVSMWQMIILKHFLVGSDFLDTIITCILPPPHIKTARRVWKKLPLCRGGIQSRSNAVKKVNIFYNLMNNFLLAVCMHARPIMFDVALRGT